MESESFRGIHAANPSVHRPGLRPGIAVDRELIPDGLVLADNLAG